VPVSTDSSYAFFMMPALRLEKVMCRRDLSLMNLISIFRRSRFPPFLSSSSSSSSSSPRSRFGCGGGGGGGCCPPCWCCCCCAWPGPIAAARSAADDTESTRLLSDDIRSAYIYTLLAVVVSCEKIVTPSYVTWWCV
jgi:hypothetical protein